MGHFGTTKRRYRFIGQGISCGARITLDPREAHHLIHVLRLKEGEKIILLDGKGKEYEAKVAKIIDKQVIVKVQEILREEEPSFKEIICLIPMLKKEKTSWLIEKAVELDIKKVIILQTLRTVVQAKKNFLEKLKNKAFQALKQCGRLWALEIEGPVTLEELEIMADLKLFAYEKGKTSIKRILKDFQGQSMAILAGPEGGFSLEEKNILQKKGFVPVSLGKQILRAETAALYLMSIAHFLLKI